MFDKLNLELLLKLLAVTFPDVFRTSHRVLGCGDGSDISGHYHNPKFDGKNPGGGDKLKVRVRATWLVLFGDASGRVPCGHCATRVDVRKTQLAHILPREPKRAGDAKGGYCPRNIVPTCSTACNDALEYSDLEYAVGTEWLPARIAQELLDSL